MGSSPRCARRRAAPPARAWSMGRPARAVVRRHMVAPSPSAPEADRRGAGARRTDARGRSRRGPATAATIDWVTARLLCPARRRRGGRAARRALLHVSGGRRLLRRAARARRRILFTPEVTITHLRGRSRQAAPAATSRAYRASHRAFYAKHHPGWARCSALISAQGRLIPCRRHPCDRHRCAKAARLRHRDVPPELLKELCASTTTPSTWSCAGHRRRLAPRARPAPPADRHRRRQLLAARADRGAVAVVARRRRPVPPPTTSCRCWCRVRRS